MSLSARYNCGFWYRMSRSIRFLVLLLLFVLAVEPAHAQIQRSIPAAPSIAAKTWLLLDYQTARVITGRDADERIEPASLTKLMTAYVIFSALKQGQLRLAQVVPVSQKAYKMSGSRMFINPNRPVMVTELLRGMMVESGNDATVALAESLAGSENEFVERMNNQAAHLGLTSTHFANATGLPDARHYSTASDLSRLAVAVIRDYPEYFPIYSLRDYTYNGITQRNRNELLFRDPFVDGIKTGYTEGAGYCLIATAKREGRRLLAVVVGADSEGARAIEAQKLLNYGFQYYETIKLYSRDAPIADLPVWKGSEHELKAGFIEDFYVSVPRGQSGNLKAHLETLQPLLAPISLQQQVGVLRITFADKPYGEFPVYALQPVAIANMFVRAWHSIQLWFK